MRRYVEVILQEALEYSSQRLAHVQGKMSVRGKKTLTPVSFEPAPSAV